MRQQRINAQPPSAAASHSQPGYKWKVLSTVVFGIFMVLLDSTVVNVAFQTLRRDFGSNINDAQWVLSVYVLALGISTPLAGFLADRFGIKRIYLGGLIVFTLGSLTCALVPNLGMLIVARGIQGFGGGIALPLGIALLLNAFPVAEQGMALGIFGIAAIVAPALGPILGGWLVDNGLWRLIFFINPPIGLIGVLLGMRFLRERRSDRRPPLDILGLTTEIVGFGAILYGASNAEILGWSSPPVVAAFVIGTIGLVLFAVVELFYAQEPLVDLRLFGKRVFLNASLLGYVSVIALFGAEFLMPLYLQALRGLSALQTGLMLLPLAIAGGFSVTLAGRLYDRLGPRPLLAAGFALLIVNTWQLSQIGADTALDWILVLLALRGMALGLTVQTTLVTALSVVPSKDLARGSSLTNATRNLVQSIGVAVLATILTSTVSPGIQKLETMFSEGPRPNAAPTHIAGICEPVTVESAAAGGSKLAVLVAGDGATRSVPGLPPNPGTLLRQACDENVAGFEKAYTLTFFAAILALFLGLMLPGWPRKWAGRRAADLPAAGRPITS
jgi:EmrB/QacA subfamily drug resistance transporter